MSTSYIYIYISTVYALVYKSLYIKWWEYDGIYHQEDRNRFLCTVTSIYHSLSKFPHHAWFLVVHKFSSFKKWRVEKLLHNVTYFIFRHIRVWILLILLLIVVEVGKSHEKLYLRWDLFICIHNIIRYYIIQV